MEYYFKYSCRHGAIVEGPVKNLHDMALIVHEITKKPIDEITNAIRGHAITNYRLGSFLIAIKAVRNNVGDEE